MASDLESSYAGYGVHPTTGALARWWTAETVAVVTGANKGIGFEIVQKLALEGITVVLTARDEGRGLKATDSLHAENLKNVVFHKLDVANPESVAQFVDWPNQSYGGLDILVNNAAVWLCDHAYDKAVECMNINYFGTMNLTNKLLLLFKKSAAGARIINVSSLAGLLQIYVEDENLRQQLSDTSKFDQDFINNVAHKYETDCEAGNDKVHLYGPNAYHVSKLLLNAYTRLLAGTLSDRPEGSKIFANCLHPGAVETDMMAKLQNFHGGLQIAEAMASFDDEFVSPEESADTPVWLALLPPGGPSGLFWRKKKVISYCDSSVAVDSTVRHIESNNIEKAGE